MLEPLDQVWLAGLLAERAGQQAPEMARDVIPAVPGVSTAEIAAVELRQDWGEAPDVLDFVGRVDELATLRDWVLEERCRLAAVLGMGGIGKTALAARLA